MDSFLSGREKVGDQPKPSESTMPAENAGGLGDFQLKASVDSSQLEEICGESGSRVSYLTEDGRVTRIIVTCDCGKVTEIDCKYGG